jgi:hypothetical protein
MTVKLRCARFLRGEACSAARPLTLLISPLQLQAGKESSVEGRGDDDGEVDPLA